MLRNLLTKAPMTMRLNTFRSFSIDIVKKKGNVEQEIYFNKQDSNNINNE